MLKLNSIPSRNPGFDFNSGRFLDGLAVNAELGLGRPFDTTLDVDRTCQLNLVDRLFVFTILFKTPAEFQRRHSFCSKKKLHVELELSALPGEIEIVRFRGSRKLDVAFVAREFYFARNFRTDLFLLRIILTANP